MALDTACGTGRYAGFLAGRGLRVVGVDGSPDMLARARTRVPRGEFLVGDLHRLPVADAGVDLVVCGLALTHVPALEPVLAEFARVLRPGGTVAALWNRDDDSVEWVAGANAAIGLRPNPGGSSVSTFPEHPALGPSEVQSFGHAVPQTIDSMIANIATHSWALTAEPAARDAALGRLRDYLAGRPETAGGSFDEPLRTDVLRAQRH